MLEDDWDACGAGRGCRACEGATATEVVPRYRGNVPFRCGVTPCCASVGAAGRDVGSVPALPRLKRLQLIQDVTIVVVMMIVIVTSGVMGGRLRVTVVDDADDLARGGAVMRVMIVVDG